MASVTRGGWTALVLLAAVVAAAYWVAPSANAAIAPQLPAPATLTPTPTLGGLAPPAGVVGPGGGPNGPRGPLAPPGSTISPPVPGPGALAGPNVTGGTTPAVANLYGPLVGNLEVGPGAQQVPATVLVVPPGAGLPTLTPTPPGVVPPAPLVPGAGPAQPPLPPFVRGVGPAQILPSPVPTATWTPTPTSTPTVTSTPTPTATPTATATVTPSIRAPANLRVASSGPAPGMYTIAWDAGNTETVAEYHVQAVGAGGELRPLFSVPGSASQAVLQGLDPGLGYTLVLRAVDLLGRESGPSNTAQTAVAPTATPVTPPFVSTQPHGTGAPALGGSQMPPSSPYGPTTQGGAPYGAPTSPYTAPNPPQVAPAAPFSQNRPGVPPVYQPGVTPR